MVVAGFAAYTDISHAHEVANEVRRVAKQMKECHGMAQVYNNRERLFGLPPTNVCFYTLSDINRAFLILIPFDSNPEFAEKLIYNQYSYLFCGPV